jgi:hypothetical protein
MNERTPSLRNGRWQPEVKGLTLMDNSIFNSWRIEDVWLDRETGSCAKHPCLSSAPEFAGGNRLDCVSTQLLSP